MEKFFIDKVHNIVINNITNENFGVGKLASLIGLSTSQTLKKVRAITGKSVNQYIREIRLTEAAYLIKETDLTIAEIAYKVGFGSQSYFNKVFRKYYGKTPGDYKFQDEETIAKNIALITKQKSTKPQKMIFFFIFIIALLIIGYVSIDKTNNQPPSIAVLPFKNISNELENKYLADGLWDDLLNHLSTINGLDVRSRQSLESYRESNKSMTEIGKELSAAYIVESSIQRVDSTIRIITQLIDAKTDRHIWSQEYDYEINDIFKIQCELAKLITHNLNIELTDGEKMAFEKYPTESMEAYQLFIKGRTKITFKTREDLSSSIELFKQAIILDPNYAEAYAELGYSYFLSRIGNSFENSVSKAKKYSEKALQINPNVSRAYVVRARIYDFEENWEKCRENFEIAIALNPNDAEAHALYAIYFGTKPIKDREKAFYHTTIAQRLNPLSKRIGSMFFNSLLGHQKFEEAKEYLDKMGFLFSEEEKFLKESNLIRSENKNWLDIILFYENKIKEDPHNAILNRLLGKAYGRILNDDINFIKYAKKAYELDSTKFNNVYTYYNALLEGKEFEEAEIIFHTNNFKSLSSKRQQLISLFDYYYFKTNYEKAAEVLKDSLIMNAAGLQARTLAQLGKRRTLDSLFTERPWWGQFKVYVFAILKERDSMYYYLEKMDGDDIIKGPNSRFEFDPYRKEERYKALLRKNYIPITHWNE